MIGSLTYRYPRLLLLSIVLILVAGASALATIPRQEDPSITNIYAMIRTPFAGADPSDVEALLTIPIEERVRRLPEVDTIESSSATGLSVVVVKLDDDIDPDRIDQVWADLRDQLEDAGRRYPAGATPSEIDLDFTGTYAAIVAVTAHHDTTSVAIPARFAKHVAASLRELPGTRTARLFGLPEEEIRVEVDPAALPVLGLDIDGLAQRIRGADGTAQAGQIESEDIALPLDVQEAVGSLEALRDIQIALDNGAETIRLGSIARISRTVQEPRATLALHGGQEAILVAVRPQDDLRIDHWMAALRTEIDRIAATTPHGLKVELIFDQSGYTSARLGEVSTSLAIGLALVFAILTLTMGMRQAIIVAVTIPMVGLATLASLNIWDVPLHQMSLTGIVVALGLVVDANIVMVHEIVLQLRRGLSRRAAIETAVAKLAGPLFASTLTTMLAFVPILLLPGPPGDFVSAIATAVILMLFWSLVIALAITPALVGFALGDTAARATAGATNSDGPVHRVLVGLLARPFISLPLLVAPPVLGLLLAAGLPAQFFPGVDRDQLQVEIHAAPGTPLGQTRDIARQVGARLAAEPEVQGVTWMVGRGIPTFYYNVMSQEGATAHYAHAMVTTRSAEATRRLLDRLQDGIGDAFPGVEIVMRQLVQGPPISAPIETRLYGQDLASLRRTGEALRQAMIDVPGVISTRATLAGGTPTVKLSIDAAKAAALRLEPERIAAQVGAALRGRVALTIDEAEERLPVRVMVTQTARQAIQDIPDLYVVSPNGRGDEATWIALSNVADFELVRGEEPRARRNGDRVNVVQAFTAASVLPQVAEKALYARLDREGFALPPGVRMGVGGDSDARSQTMGDLQATLGIIVVLAMASVIVTFNSFRLAAVSGLICVMSVGLSLLSLHIFSEPMGIMASIGIIGATGVSINAAIILLSSLQAEPQAISGYDKAIATVVIRSMPHILSTSITTFMGFLPLYLNGGNFWPPFAIAVGGGVLLSAAIALLVTPILFQLWWAAAHRSFVHRLAQLKPS